MQRRATKPTPPACRQAGRWAFFSSLLVWLPPPDKVESALPLESVLKKRRSVREFSGEPLTHAELSQLLWAAQGVTDPDGLRTVPSAGALYPLEVYIAVGDVSDLPAGVYRYQPDRHRLVPIVSGDRRAQLAEAALAQRWIETSAAVITFAAIFQRTTWKYGERGVRYVHMEVGHAAQNVYLQSVALGLGTVVVGAFSDRDVKEVLNMSSQEEPICLMPVGHIASQQHISDCDGSLP